MCEKMSSATIAEHAGEGGYRLRSKAAKSCVPRAHKYQTKGITALTTYGYVLCMCAFVQCVVTVRTWRCARETCGPIRGFLGLSSLTIVVIRKLGTRTARLPGQSVIANFGLRGEPAPDISVRIPFPLGS